MPSDLTVEGWNQPGTTSVVVATRNRPGQAQATVGRLVSLPERPPVIVVADGCTEGTAETIRRRYPWVEVIGWEKSRGAAAARNAGVAAASTPHVAFCDDDSWWAPGALASISAAFEAHPHLGLVAARILVGEEQNLDPTCADMARSPLPSEGLPGPRILGFVACGSAVRRDAFVEAGGFPERYVIGGEEDPLAFALAAAGWDLAYLEDAVAYHRPSPLARNQDRRDRRVFRNDLWTAWRWRPPAGALRRTADILAAADTPAKRRGVTDAAKGLPHILGERRPIPPPVEAHRRMLDDGAAPTGRRDGALTGGSTAGVRVVPSHVRSEHGRRKRLGLVVATHNRVDELLENLGRLRALPERPHIVVVDNGSEDGTAEMVQQRHPDIDLIRLDRNAGACGRNVAVEHLSTPYVGFADDDTWWESGSLRHACEILDAHPDIAVVTARIVVELSGDEDPVVADMAESPLIDTVGLPGRPLVGFLAGASVVRRDAFLAVGGFHPRIRIGGEEELLSMDLMARGWHLRYVPEMTVHHAASTLRDPQRRRADGLRNTLWSTWLRRPFPRALRRSVLLLRCSTPDRVTARALAEAVGGVPWVMRERQLLPPAIEHQLRLIEDTQLRSPARRYSS